MEKSNEDMNFADAVSRVGTSGDPRPNTREEHIEDALHNRDWLADLGQRLDRDELPHILVVLVNLHNLVAEVVLNHLLGILSTQSGCASAEAWLVV